MDFRFSEEHVALRELAREILGREVTPDRLKRVAREGTGFDRETWARLADSSLLGLAVAEAQGGMGMGFLELCGLLVELGRAVAAVPALPALVHAGLPIARFGSEAQRDRWLAPLVKGETILTGAFAEGRPPVADGGALSGELRGVPAVAVAERVLVPGVDERGEALFWLDPRGPGVALQHRRTSIGDPLTDIALDAAPVAPEEALRAPGILEWTLERALVALAAVQLGVSERALEITTGYLSQREQFGAPLGALPPVQHRCADCYVALDALRWVTWRAAWKLAEERPASRDARVAKFWAAEAGSQIATATQHLHGGMGVDLDYPIHRYFLRAKLLELSLGAATPQLASLGRELARAGPREQT